MGELDFNIAVFLLPANMRLVPPQQIWHLAPKPVSWYYSDPQHPTTSATEDHAIWLTAPEQLLNRPCGEIVSSTPPPQAFWLLQNLCLIHRLFVIMSTNRTHCWALSKTNTQQVQHMQDVLFHYLFWSVMTALISYDYRPMDVDFRSGKWRQCRSARDRCSPGWPAEGDSVSMEVYEKTTSLLTWFITSGNIFFLVVDGLSLWFQVSFNAAWCSVDELGHSPAPSKYGHIWIFFFLKWRWSKW